MKCEAELITDIIHQLSFELIRIFSEAVIKLASLPRPKLCRSVSIAFNIYLLFTWAAIFDKILLRTKPETVH